MKVRYSRRALEQIEEISRYITTHNPRAAKQVVARIEELCDRLGEFQGIGHMTDQPGTRVLPVVRYPYLIFYTIIAAHDEVRIARVRHGKRRPLSAAELASGDDG
jgi:addiction module RelE/StbE family toxin